MGKPDYWGVSIYVIQTYLNGQRVENAEFDAVLLDRFCADFYPALSMYLDKYTAAKRRRMGQILSFLAERKRRSVYLQRDGMQRVAESKYPFPTKSWTCIPYKKLIAKYGGAKTTYTNIINFMLLAGMLEKFDPSRAENIDEYVTGSAYEYMEAEGNKRPAILYHLPKWDEEILQRAEELAEDNPRLKTYLDIIDQEGLERAQEVYDTDRREKKKVGKARKLVEKIVETEIAKKGYTTKKKIIGELRRSRRKYLEGVDIWRLVNDYMKPLCKKKGLRYRKPRNAEIEQWNLRNRKYIITAK